MFKPEHICQILHDVMMPNCASAARAVVS